jgi:hypothetical protein
MLRLAKEHTMRNRTIHAIVMSLCAAALANILAAQDAPAARPAACVWLEGEGAVPTNVKPNLAGWGRKEFLSGEKWLHLSIDADKVDRDVPGDGALLAYPFAAPADGNYEIWHRIGFEFVRSPYDWRIDGGAWSRVSPDDLTTDLMEVDFWCEVAWLKAGRQQLAKGPHKLEFRLPKLKDDKGKTARILFALDAVCLCPGEFSPNGPFKPGEEGRNARDLEAAKQVFELPEPAGAGQRATVSLAGGWEVCRHDEQRPGETARPIADLPAHPHWKAIDVPGDKNTLRPDLEMAHRIWCRTRVRVAETAAGRSFHVVFPQNNLNTTVYVNGTYCGFNNTPFARFDIDVTKAVKPGVNELWVGIRDAWYGYSTNPADPMKLRKKFNLPQKYFHDGFQDLAYPVWNHPESGMLAAPEFVAAGPVKVADVFCKPSVARKELALEVTLRNPGPKAVSGQLLCGVVHPRTKNVERPFAPVDFSLPAGSEKTLHLAEKWENPRLWWPHEPQLYDLRASLHVNGQVVDESETRFGFREWTIDGRDFKLNGVVWHGWADCFTAKDPQEWIKFYRKSNQQMMRFWGTTWMDLPPQEALDFFDVHGVVVRRSGMLDGEAIGYMAVENDPQRKKESELKMDLMRNWREQVVAQVKGERNHPSVMIWSIENEWLYINCINLYGGLMDKFEAEVKKVSDAVRAADPTRPTMTDGGGANKDQSMPVCGNHYVFTDFPRYPDLAYEANPAGGGRDRWTWDQKRPRFIGEDFFANGINPFDYSYFGGEETFQGKAQSHRAAGIMYRMLTEGYRWAGYGAWHFWMGQNEATDQYVSNSLVAVFCREWDWTFGSGQNVKRTLRIFNDTCIELPITFTWSLAPRRTDSPSGLDEATQQEPVWYPSGGTSLHKVPPGSSQEVVLSLRMPTVGQRTEGEFLLTLSLGERPVFRDTKAVSVLDAVARIAAVPAAPGRQDSRAPGLLVYDPQGTVVAFLKRRAIPCTPLESLKTLPDAGKLLLLGKDALGPTDCDSSKFQAWAAAGRAVIVLEQKNPLRYQALPAEMELATNEGRTAFAENLEHPAFAGLAQKDFFCWSGDHVVYRNAYVKPARGARSLVQCHNRLQNTALAEAPCGKGVILLSQLAIGEKLAQSAVAQRLLANLIGYAAGYKLEYGPVAVCTRDIQPQLATELENVKLRSAPAADPLAALRSPGVKTAIVPASPPNLKALAANLNEVNRFTESGGTIFFHDLTPAGLADYNKIVGFEHMIRPFGRERVGLPAKRSPLMAGLTLSDVVMRSGEQIFPWTSDEYVASDVFTYVVDYDDVAPFARFPDDFTRNMVNGMVSADAWKYIVNVPAPESGRIDWLLRLPKEQEIVEMEWIGNTFYYPVTEAQLVFDGNEAGKATFATQPTNDPQTFTVDPPRRGRDITLRLSKWEKAPGKNAVTGLDNIALRARRPPEFLKTVRPLLNIGAMMEYTRGRGGIVLCNLKFQAHEAVPENALKKRAILTAILRNLKAPFAEGKQIVAGANLQYEPIDLAQHCTQFRDEKGWFGDKAFTFKDLPAGRQQFAGVTYRVHHFETSPVPTVVMLAGPGVPNNPPQEVRGIPVNRKADALFFLQAARIDRRRSQDEIKQKKQFELCRYVVHYADGQTAVAPIYGEIDADDYRQQGPRAVPGAQLAWVRPYEKADSYAVAYSKQWNNPRPEVAIQSIDLVYGPERCGVPALIALTAATGK